MANPDLEHIIKATFIYLFKSVLQHFPADLLYPLVEYSTLLTFKIDQNRRGLMREEVRKLFGAEFSENQINKIVRRAICNVRKDALETIMMPYLTPGRIEEMTSFVQLEHLEAALTQQKGVFIVLAHFGFRKLILPALGFKGYKVNQIAVNPLSLRDNEQHRLPPNKMIEMEYRSEQSYPVKFIYLDKFLRPLFRALENNEIIVIAIDGPIGLRRVGVRFFSRTAHLSVTPFSLSLKYGTPILPVFVIRQEDNRHKIIMERPLVARGETDEGTDNGLAIEKNMKNYVRLLEKYVWDYPCHYADWLYRASQWPIAKDFFVFQ